MSCITENVKRHVFQRYIVGILLLSHIFACFARTSSNIASKNKVQIENIHGYSLNNITIQLSEEFKKISNEELGVSVIQGMYNKLKYTSVVQDIDKVVKKMANKLESKLNETITILNRTRDRIESYSKFNSSQIQSTITPCGYLGDGEKRFEIITIDPNNSYSELPLPVQQVLTKQKASAKKLKGAIKQFYLLSTWDVVNNFDAPISNCNDQDQSLLWKLYMQHTHSLPKNVMLLLDHGGSLSKQQFHIVKAVAKQMISVLNKKDKVGVLAISDEWSSPYLTDQCLMPNQIPQVSDSHVISPATQHNKYLLNKFIDSLTKGNGVTNHSLGFQQALQTIKVSNISSNESVMLLYISRGLLSSLTEAKIVLETIAYMFDDIDNPVVINTCAVIDESKPIMYETHFLRDIAEQNYTKYNIDTLYEAEKGIMLPVNSSQAIGLAVARFYNIVGSSDYIDLEPKLSLPIWDNTVKDLSISLTIPCGTKGEIGLLGLDLLFSNIAEDVTYYSNHQHYTYAFIINMEGIAVMHPSYPRPASIKEQPKFVDILNLEKTNNFKEVRELLLYEKEGSYILNVNNETLKYIWKRVKNWYVICAVIRENKTAPVRPYKVTPFPSSISSKLVHHRLDILPVSNLCKHLNQIATLDAGSLYLSPSCFQSPFSYIHTPTGDTVSKSTVQNYMAYLKDSTRLIANPGLKEEVRDDVVALAHILEFLRVQHLNGSRAKYIVRRYVTSSTGVLQVFPGGFVSPGVEPTKRSWYLHAVEHRNQTILTPPYLDAGGAGYIVTIAYATSHVVAAMDVTFGYVYKLMLQRMPFCTKNIKCFMMDDRGYLIYHPNLIDPNGHGPIEQQHIIHKESVVANDILNHKHFVKKMLCNNYADGTIQRYYRLNTSLIEVLVNALHSEHCVKYQVSAVEGTNIFVGMVNATCEVVVTFCPCSMVDRLCLNCNRMEQTECECPCECPLNLDTCTHPNRTFMDNPLCSTLPEQSFPVLPHTQIKVDNELKSCIPVMCESHLTYESCLGILGCAWCQLDVDGESLLTNPFCTSFSTCFNGILGSVTPYGDAVGGPSSSEDLLGSTYSPIGPIIGSIVGICLVLALLFFCYRSYNSPTVERFYLTSAQDNRVRMSDFNMSDDFQELDNHQDKLLQDTKKREPISPYCVSTGYRRPLTAADSDHGYSTMTPHDESEHLSFAPVEIDSLEDDCTSDATSINTSISSKQPKGNAVDPKNKMRTFPQLTDLQLTTIPNRIIAPVTVHRNMEVTQCTHCYNVKTNQVSSNVLDIPLDIKPSKCDITTSSLKISWQDGHETEYSLHWLENINFPIKRKKEIVLWDASNVLSFQDTKVPVDVFFKDDSGTKCLLKSLLKYGFGFVTGVEPTLEATKKVVKHIAPPQKTFFGEMWMVSNDYYHSDTAYTNIALGLHTDNTYFTEAAGLQIFHMFSHIGTGGETLLIDGFNVANSLRNKNRNAFETLCNDPIESRYIEAGYHFSTIDHVIKLHPLTKELFQIRFNVYDRATFNSLPQDKVLKFYEAYHLLGKEMCDPKYEFKIKLSPGSVLFFDNWRLLHGRAAYTGKRDLGGCYLTRAEWLSKARSLDLEIN